MKKTSTNRAARVAWAAHSALPVLSLGIACLAVATLWLGAAHWIADLLYADRR